MFYGLIIQHALELFEQAPLFLRWQQRHLLIVNVAVGTDTTFFDLTYGEMFSSWRELCFVTIVLCIPALSVL